MASSSSISNDNKSLLDTLTDGENANPAQALTDEEWNQHLESLLDQLTTNQQEVVVRRFGLRGFEKCTLEEVGEDIGLTRERVRQIQVEALKALRGLLKQEGISQEDLF